MTRIIALLLALALPATVLADDHRVIRDDRGRVTATVERTTTDRLVVRDRAGRVTYTIERAAPRLDRRVIRDRGGRIVGTIERR